MNSGNFRNTFLSLSLIAVALFAGGCEWINGGSVAKKTDKKTEKAPPAPVVVDGVRTSYADIVEKTSPAVVQIRATMKAKAKSNTEFPFPFPFDRNQQQPQLPPRGAGSGVIVKEDGTILTNHHVVDDASRIEVETVDGTIYTAKLIGTDRPSDLAVIKIEGKDFPYLTLGDSEKVRVGDIVLAIGNPLGVGQTVTSGIISAKGRRTRLAEQNSYQNFLQTDAPINRGNSGGALVSVQGELIGINTQIVSQSGGSIGIGFAVPSNLAADVLKQLVETGKVRRGLLGVNIQPLNKELAEQFGVESKGAIVTRVTAGSAAEKAGIKRDDVITKIDGEQVEDPTTLRNKVATIKPGSKVKVTIVRDKKEQVVEVTLGELEVAKKEETDKKEGDTSEPQTGSEDKKLGVTVAPNSKELAGRMKLEGEVEGLVVTNVDPSGPAANAGIAQRDVILEVNRTKVATLEDMKTALGKSDGATILFIRRGEATVYVTVRP